MKIAAIREITVAVGGTGRSAGIGFKGMTASGLALATDSGLTGYAFDSIGRYGHGRLVQERLAPRVLDASPAEYEDGSGGIDPLRLWAVAMRDEKPGGHGERAGAVGLLDAAAWDLVAKIADRPLWALLAERFNRGRALRRVPVYASGGHYREADDLGQLQAELRCARERGHRHFKIKIAGAPLGRDLARIETAVSIAGGGANLAVDANAALDSVQAVTYAEALAPLGLAWLEEPLDPLDYDAHRDLAARTAMPLAVGENLFSAADVRNLLRHGGLRPGCDYLQMDVSLSYGIAEYLRMLAAAEPLGWARERFLPHAGHLLAFHVVAGLGLGRHETASAADSLFGGYPDGVAVEDGAVVPWDRPGVGFEAKPELWAILRQLA